MAQITLPRLPRKAVCVEVPVAAGVTQRPAWGGPLLPLARTGDHWAFEVSIPVLAAATCGAAFRLALAKGKTNTVIMRIPEPGMPVRDYGTPRTAVAGQEGTSLTVKGLAAGVVIPSGKWMSLVINGRHYLYLIDGEVTADASGNAALKLWPMIRRSAPADAVILLAEPVIEGFGAMDSGVTVRRLGRTGTMAVNFRIEEEE